MQRARWYGLLTRRHDGSLYVAGHSANPMMPPGITETSATRERALVDDTAHTLAWPDGLSENQEWSAANACAESGITDLHDYPRMLQLPSLDLLWVTEEHYLLRHDICLGQGGEPHRLIRGNVAGVPELKPQRAGGSALLIVDLTGPAPATTVYAVGGASFDNLLTDSITNRVLKLTDPDESATWNDTGAPDLNRPRLDHNTVFALDGSMVVLGGYDTEDEVNALIWKTIELYKPPEVFATPSTGWEDMVDLVDERSYHSVAVTLSTGDIVSAGGQGSSVAQFPALPVADWYSVELYSPAYMYVTPRPAITSAPASVEYGDTFFVSAVLQSTSAGEEFRVALIGPGATTHAFDANQRYVMLEWGAFTPNPDPSQESTIPVSAPPASTPGGALGGGIAPPGWYMLTVVNSFGFPSEAVWIQVLEP
jgi:hypothetical protein